MLASPVYAVPGGGPAAVEGCDAGAYPGAMSAQRNRISPISGGRRPVSPLGPALLAAAAGVVLAGVRRMRARSRRRSDAGVRTGR